jgi:hypothetical protein
MKGFIKSGRVVLTPEKAEAGELIKIKKGGYGLSEAKALCNAFMAEGRALKENAELNAPGAEALNRQKIIKEKVIKLSGEIIKKAVTEEIKAKGK